VGCAQGPRRPLQAGGHSPRSFAEPKTETCGVGAIPRFRFVLAGSGCSRQKKQQEAAPRLLELFGPIEKLWGQRCASPKARWPNLHCWALSCQRDCFRGRAASSLAGPPRKRFSFPPEIDKAFVILGRFWRFRRRRMLAIERLRSYLFVAWSKNAHSE